MRLVALLVSALIAPQAGWDNVRSIPPGSTVRVETDQGQELRGRMLEATDTVITVSQPDRPVSVPAGEVRQVIQLRRRTGAVAWRGLVVGAAGGAVWGAVSVRSNRPAWIAMLAGGWGAIGSLIGAISGHADEEVRVVYRRP